MSRKKFEDKIRKRHTAARVIKEWIKTLPGGWAGLPEEVREQLRYLTASVIVESLERDGLPVSPEGNPDK